MRSCGATSTSTIDSLPTDGSASRAVSASCLGVRRRLPPRAAAAIVERRRAIDPRRGPALPRNCAFYNCEPVASDAAGVQVRSLRRLDAEPDAPAAGLLGCDRALVGVVAVPLPTARSPPPDSSEVGTDVV